MELKINMGMVDKIVRITVGVVLIALTLMGSVGIWGWIGLVPLITGLLGHCPVYAVLGFDTCSTPK
jgi:hypothetical protein